MAFPAVMGIINLTDDSFYSGSRAENEDSFLRILEKQIAEGADIIDLGASSSRPGSAPVSENQEQERIHKALELIKLHASGTLVSVDTWRSSVAELALRKGVSMINDISAGSLDPDILKVVAQYKVPYIAMHMRGTPEHMHLPQNQVYDHLIPDLIKFFAFKLDELRGAGIHQVILDPGFGFSKNIRQNFSLLRNLSQFRILERPILVGISRKSMIYKTLGQNAEEALNGTTAAHMLALVQGASILRVHDVREARETIKIYESYRDSET
jgi:dihydropteroate synthase